MKNLHTKFFNLYLILFVLLFLTPLESKGQKTDAVKFVTSGIESERTGNSTEALFYYTLAAEMDPNYADAFYCRGKLYKRMKNYGKAKNDFLQVISINSGNESVLMELGFLNTELKDYLGAIKMYSKEIDLNTSNSDAYFYRGNANNLLGNYQDAADDYTKALELNPSNTDAYAKLNTIKDKLGSEITGNTNSDKNGITQKETKSSGSLIVENTFEDNNTKNNSENKNITGNDGTKEDKQKEPVKNNTSTKEPVKNNSAVNKEPVNNTSTNIKTEEPISTDNPDKSVENKQELPSAESFILTGLSYFENKDYQKALDEYNKATGINPSFAEAYYHKGRAYSGLNDFDNAIKEYTKAIELNPAHEKAYINRGYIYSEIFKQYDKAIADFKKGIELNSNSVFGYYNMGVAYFNLGNKNAAVENFRMAARLGDSETQEWLTKNGYSW